MSIPNQSLHERDVRSSVHHFTDLDAHQTQGPFIVETGDGIYVYDTDGKKYLDSLAGAWCTSLGFSEKRLAKAAYEQMCRMPYSHTFSHRTMEEVGVHDHTQFIKMLVLGSGTSWPSIRVDVITCGVAAICVA